MIFWSVFAFKTTQPAVKVGKDFRQGLKYFFSATMGTLNYSEPILYIVLKIFICVQNVEEKLKIVKAVCFEKWLLKYLNIQKHKWESYLGFDGNLSNIKHQPNPTHPVF